MDGNTGAEGSAVSASSAGESPVAGAAKTAAASSPNSTTSSSTGQPLTYSIADLAKEFDVTPRTLRYYEDEGLVTPARCGQQRIYSHTDRVRLGWIMRGKRVGFSIADIKEMLALYNLGDDRQTQRKVTIEKCETRLQTLEAQRDDLDRVIAELSGFCDTLRTMIREPKTGRWIDPVTGRPPARENLSITGPDAPPPLKKT